MQVRLTRTSHQLPAAVGDALHPAVFSHFGVLDVLSSTTPRPSDRKPSWAQRLADLATKAGEKCGLSIVIPALDESDRLPPTLERIGSFLDDNPGWLPAEIIVVDDGSKDETAAAARATKLPDTVRLHVADHPGNLGKGAAVRTGFGLTTGDWVLLTDADLSAPIEELLVLAAAAESGGVTIGSRAVDRHLVEIRQPLHRDLMGRTFNLIVRMLGLSGIHDTQCGFKLFPGNLARDLSAVQRLDGFAFDVELLVIARSWGYRIREVGVRWRHIEASRVLAVRHSAQMLRDLLRLWWWRMTGRLPQPPEDSK